MAQRLQDLARPAGTTVISEATLAAASACPPAEALAPQQVKGRTAPVIAHRIVHVPEPTAVTTRHPEEATP
jgi:class 3 adenylate cyclase